MKNIKSTLGLVLVFCLLSTSCAEWSKTAKGAAIGTAAGAAAGAVVGKVTGNTATGAIIGAAVGGTAGALIGRRMDKQADEIRDDLKNATVERVGEGIKITFDSGILFAVNSATLTSQAKQNIADLAVTLNKYDDTNIFIVGHTDSSGASEYNQELSERRANAVADHSAAMGVNTSRINTMGVGEDDPVADNGTTAGKAANRRVELAIFANEKLQRAAKRGDITVD